MDFLRLKKDCNLLCVAFMLVFVSKHTWTFPMYPQAVFYFPPQNFLPQHFPAPLMSPFRTSSNAMQLFRRAPTSPSTGLESSASSDQQKELNGHQNPHTPNNQEYEASVMQENILNQDYQDQDTVSIEAGTPLFPEAVPVITQDADGRFSIGQVITAVPWLPIQVNVPDTISWMYNGISSIIGGIGQRIPFLNRPADEPRPYTAMDQMQGRRPIFMPIRMFRVPILFMNDLQGYQHGS